MRFIVFTLAMILVPAAWGFGVSPCLRKLTFIDEQFDQKKMAGASWLNACDLILRLNFKAAVHEHMTLASIARFRGGEHLTDPRKRYPSEYMIEKPWESPLGRKHETRGFIFGVWWNDDPLRLTWGQSTDFFSGSWNVIGAVAREAENYSGAGSCDVPAKHHLGRQSHFEKLQHLHFMTPEDAKTSNSQQRVESTTRLALAWMNFAYYVAIGEYAPNARLTEVLKIDAGLPSISTSPKPTALASQTLRSGRFLLSLIGVGMS